MSCIHYNVSVERKSVYAALSTLTLFFVKIGLAGKENDVEKGRRKILFTNKALKKLIRTAQIAANGVANSIDQVAVMVVNAVNLAIYYGFACILYFSNYYVRIK